MSTNELYQGEQEMATSGGPIKVAFAGSECYPFIKTGGLGDVMYALPRALIRENCEVRVFLPLYKCMPEKYHEGLEFKGSFMMQQCMGGQSYYVGIMETERDGVIYDFIDNKEFFDWGNPYTGLWEDIPKYCYFSKAVLAALNYLEWIPDVIHCHDWQASLTPIYLRTQFVATPVGRAQSILTIHNLRFQGICSLEHLKYWSDLPDSAINDYGVLRNGDSANMFKGGLAYADRITTVSATYAHEIQTLSYGEGLDGHLRYHREKLSGIVNGIDVEQWDPMKDPLLPVNYGPEDAWDKKRENKRALQEKLGLEQDEKKMLIGLVSRLTDQKGLDLVDSIFADLMDGNTQVVVLGTGDPRYEEAFRYYERNYAGAVKAIISYNEALAHQIYAGSDALLVPSLFEPCGLTQLIAMRYGAIPIVRETGGLKDTVFPYDITHFTGNGFTFDRYQPQLLLNAINNAKTLYFTDRWHWDEMSRRDMEKDVSWEQSALQYLNLYQELREQAALQEKQWLEAEKAAKEAAEKAAEAAAKEETEDGK